MFALLSRDMEDIFEKTQNELLEMKTTMSELEKKTTMSELNITG